MSSIRVAFCLSCTLLHPHHPVQGLTRAGSHCLAVQWVPETLKSQWGKLAKNFLNVMMSGLPWWLSWWRIHLQCGKPGFDPWVGKIPWRRERLQCSGLENSMDCIVHGVAKSQTRLSECICGWVPLLFGETIATLVIGYIPIQNVFGVCFFFKDTSQSPVFFFTVFTCSPKMLPDPANTNTGRQLNLNLW